MEASADAKEHFQRAYLIEMSLELRIIEPIEDGHE